MSENSPIAMSEQGAHARWARLRECLAEFQSFLSARVPALTVTNACDFHWSDEVWKAKRDSKLLRQCGVYLMFDKDEYLIYVGVAGWLDKRIWSHDEQAEFRRRHRRWTDVILLAKEHAFFAPALEQFLIARLEPAHNLKRR